MVSNFFKQWFGDFSKDELFKFLKLGLIFAFIIGIYWALRPLKDSVFQELIGASWQPTAKVLSLVVLFPILMVYSKMIDKFPRNQLFYILSTIYTALALFFAVAMFWQGVGSAEITPSPWNMLGWSWYIFVESFGSLIVALFWAFTTDITTAESGKKGFSVVVMLGQIGGFVAPAILTVVLGKHGFLSTSQVVLGLSFFIFALIPLVWYFLKSTPASQLKGFDASEKLEENKTKAEKHEEAGFMEGLKLMVSQPYLLAIFGAIFFYEVIVTVIDYHFKFMVQAGIPDVNLRGAYLSGYGMYANLATFLCLLFGISNITRRLGVTTALSLMPIIVAAGVLVFKFYANLSVLFWIMVAAKAINYALNGPAMKQLYIPVSDEARYKSQAWIETFGSRGSKATASGANMLHPVLVKNMNGAGWANFDKIKGMLYGSGDLGSALHIGIASYLFLGVCGIWFFLALYLGRTYQKAVDNNKVVC